MLRVDADFRKFPNRAIVASNDLGVKSADDSLMWMITSYIAIQLIVL